MDYKKKISKFFYLIAMLIGSVAVKSLNTYSWVGMYKFDIPDSLKELKK